jgi:UDP-N-acetylmuramate dehydrogenase
VKLSDYTTLGLGGTAHNFIAPETESELARELSALDAAGEDVLILGGGSNLVINDAPFDGTALYLGRGLGHLEVSTHGEKVILRAGAGVLWDAFVARAVAEHAVGLECLSGIPGLVGGAPIQNIGAYGQEVVDTLAWVRVYDRQTHGFEIVLAKDCGLRYRHSRFKGQSRYVVTEVQFECARGAQSAKLRYAELTRALALTEAEPRAPLAEVRATVLQLRKQKGMVLDAQDPDSRSAGSFFTNPIVDNIRAVVLDAPIPEYPAGEGRTKLAAGFLIERAGFVKGQRYGAVGLSSKHALALVNYGNGSSRELMEFAHIIAQRVHACFGVTLMPEPVLVGLTW